MEEKWNFNLEFISDGKCANEITPIDAGSKRYYKHHPNQSVCCTKPGEQCSSFCDNFAFKDRHADVFIGMPCDSIYFGFLELSRSFNSADLTNGFMIEGTGLPMITSGYRGQSTRFKDGAPPFKPFKNVIRVGPTIANFIRPLELLIAKFGWRYFTTVGYDWTTSYAYVNAIDYGFPYMEHYSDAYEKFFTINEMTKPFGCTSIQVTRNCATDECNEKHLKMKRGQKTLPQEAEPETSVTQSGPTSCDGASDCPHWLASQIEDNSRIVVWILGVDDFVEVFDGMSLYLTNDDEHIVSDPSFLHIYLNDGSQKSDDVKAKLAAYSNVVVIEDRIASNPITTVPPCDIADDDKIIAELIDGSPILRAFYNSIGLVDTLFTTVQQELAPDNFRRVPGSYYQGIVRMGHVEFNGWKNERVAFDDLADEVTPSVLYKYSLSNVAAVKFDENGNMHFENDELEAKFKEFDYTPKMRSSSTRNILISVLSITIAIAIVTIFWLYRTFRVGDRWDLRTEDVIFNIKKRTTVNTDGSELPSDRATVVVNNTSALYLPKKTYADVGVTKGHSPRLIAYKKINRFGRIVLTKEEEQLASVLIGLKHPNVVKFEGLIRDITGLNYSLRLSEYVNKGSLYDLLQDHQTMPSISLDMKLCFIKDIINGMAYIQRSPLGHHGRLTSRNCLVDARFQLKISDFETVLTDTWHRREAKNNEQFLEQLLWIDPVLVKNSDFGFIPDLARTNFRTFDVPRGESKQHDVYSFGIILQELVYRRGPFFLGPNEHGTAISDKVTGIINGSLEPYAKDYMQTSPNHSTKQLLLTCLDEDPTKRYADFKTINRIVSRAYKLEKSVVEIILETLEIYAKDLEKQVRCRINDYGEQKKRADEINYQLLPRSVAEEFKATNAVVTKTYEDVSLYFSDIVGFTAIGKKSTPVQIMQMMDALFKLFDSIISKFNCTKVETIGDAYFVVSGCPEPIDDHAVEIAKFALAIRNSYVVDFKIPHLPQDRLRMRIGLHSGSVAASVVGKKMPRWCLFGEDLTTVANCESNGEANKIHLSRAIFDKLRCARYSNNLPIFDLGFGNYEANLVGDFEIVERRLDFGNAEERRKTQSSFEVLGQTYFLIRDRFEKKKIYPTDSPSVNVNGELRRTTRRTRHTSLNEDDRMMLKDATINSDLDQVFTDNTTHLDNLEFGRRTNHHEDNDQQQEQRRTTRRRDTRRTSVAGRITQRQRTVSEI